MCLHVWIDTLNHQPLLILATVIFIKPICSIKVCTRGRYGCSFPSSSSSSCCRFLPSSLVCINNGGGVIKNTSQELAKHIFWPFWSSYSARGRQKYDCYQGKKGGIIGSICRQNATNTFKLRDVGELFRLLNNKPALDCESPHPETKKKKP